MMAVTLQNGLNRLYLFPLEQNDVICFRKKLIGSELKAHFFSYFFNFRTQLYESSKKVRLEFETKQIGKSAP